MMGEFTVKEVTFYSVNSTTWRENLSCYFAASERFKQIIILPCPTTDL